MIFSMHHFKRFWKISIFCVLLLSACESSRHPAESEIENPNSEVLHFLLDVNDIPSNWDFVSITQPSRATWLQQENLLDSASIYMSGDYRLSEKNTLLIFFMLLPNILTLCQQEMIFHYTLFLETTKKTKKLSLLCC